MELNNKPIVMKNSSAHDKTREWEGKRSHNKLQQYIFDKKLKNTTKSRRVSFGASLLSVVVAFVLHSLLYEIVNSTVTQPYMDEVFHVPQAQHYCKGDWRSWDEDITTFPGLYVISAALRRFLRFFSLDTMLLRGIFKENASTPSSCPCSFLRAINAVIFAPLCVKVLWLLLVEIHGEDNILFLTLRLIRVSTFPVHLFFHFLFYTDTISTFFVLLMYLLALRGRTAWSGIIGAVAVSLRQTNIVWLCGAALLIIWHLDPHPSFRIIKCFIPGYAWDFRPFSSPASYRKNLLLSIAKRTYVHCICVLCFFVFFIVNDFNVAVGHVKFHKPAKHLAQVVYLSGYLAIFGGPYFWMMFKRKACQLLWHILPTPRRIFGSGRTTKVGTTKPGDQNDASPPQEKHSASSSVRIRLLRVVAYFIVFFFCSRFGTIVHPFILADNRHLVFYLWRKVLKYSIVRVYLAPICLAAFFEISSTGDCIAIPMALRGLLSSHSYYRDKTDSQQGLKNDSLEEKKDSKKPTFTMSDELEERRTSSQSCLVASRRVYMLTFWLCSSLTLVPTGLLELRYFIVPTLIFLMHNSFEIEKASQRPNRLSFILNEAFSIAIHLVLNVVVFYFFLYRPFKLADGSTARFMY